MASNEPSEGAIEELVDIYTMTSLEQVKVVADPLRVRILGALCLEARTTKQVAELLGEKPTRLYHHVEALAQVGLIHLVDTRPVRGTVEKYYRAVGRAFRTDPALFRQLDAADDESQTMANIATTVLQITTDEIQELIRSGYDLVSGDDGILSHIELRAGDEEIREVHDRLMAFLNDLESQTSQSEPPEGVRRYRLNIAWFPLDRAD